MIKLRKAEDRRHERRREQESWLTFHQQERGHPLVDDFKAVEGVDEYRVAPGARLRRQPCHHAEVISCVREGVLAYEDSTGSGILQAGEFQCRSVRHGIRHLETNVSRTHWAHVLQVSLRPSEAELEPGHEQRRFTVAQRRGGLCVVASPDARGGSLRIHQDALMYSALLDPGQHVVHELSPGRSAWLHLVQGEVTLGDVVLTTGDGAGVTAELAVSLTAREETEILLLDLGEPSARAASAVRGL